MVVTKAMPDMLAHVFVAYATTKIIICNWERVDERYVTIGMVGAFIPELVKIKLLVPTDVITRALGIPFHWGSLATGGGVLVSLVIGTLMLDPYRRYHGGILLGVGAITHLVTDSLNKSACNFSEQLFWPLLPHRLPSPGLYLSSQPEVTAVTGIIAAIVWSVCRTLS